MQKIIEKVKEYLISCCSMKTKVMGSLVTSEMVSQGTILGENIVIVNVVEESIQNKMPEIVKKVPRVSSKGTVQVDDRGFRKPNYLPIDSKEGENDIE